MTKYVVHLHPVTDGAGKDMPNTFEIDADRFDMEHDTAVFRRGAVVAAFPAHSFRGVVAVDGSKVKVDRTPDSLDRAAADARANLVQP